MNKSEHAMKLTIGALLVFLLCAPGHAFGRMQWDGYLNAGERALFEKTTRVLDYGYGYDAEVELPYVFPYSSQVAAPEKREKAFSEAVKDVSAAELTALYEKVYRLTSATRYRARRYGDTQKWKYYTYLQNYLLPPLERYLELLRKHAIGKDPSYEEILPSRKKRIDAMVSRYYREQEVAEMRKDFYY